MSTRPWNRLHAAAGHPVRGRFSRCRGSSSDLRVDACCPPSQDFRLSGLRRQKLAAYSCGGSAGIAALLAAHRTSLLATMPCDVADRDAYIWCASRADVKGSNLGIAGSMRQTRETLAKSRRLFFCAGGRGCAVRRRAACRRANQPRNSRSILAHSFGARASRACGGKLSL